MNDQTIPLFSAALVNGGIDLLTPLQRVVQSNWYILGREVQAFEAEFAGYVGVEHCVSVANGTDALVIALRGVGVCAGDRVALVANAGFYSSTAVLAVGAVPQFVEVDSATLTLSPTALETVLATRPKAVIVTHLYGQLAEIERITALCADAGVPLIEDCAQSHGARRGGRQAGSFGLVSCFSFYPTKNLGALGDGGAVVTGDAALAGRMRALRQYGWSDKYTVSVSGGGNSRLDEMQAAVLRVKLPLLDTHNAQRRAIAARYTAAFAGLPVECPQSVGEDFVAHLYVIRVADRSVFRERMKAHGVATDVHYPIPDHLQPAYTATSARVSLPVTELASAQVVSLPCFPGLADADVTRVIAAVQAAAVA